MKTILRTIVVTLTMLAAVRANVVGGPSGDVIGTFVINLSTRGNIK